MTGRTVEFYSMYMKYVFIKYIVFLAALAHSPKLFVLHMERNSIAKLEPSGLLSSAAPNLRELYLTNNTITAIAKDALDSELLAILHLDLNQLTEVPTHALSNATYLEELNLSHNSIKWVGPNAFQVVSQSLKKLKMDEMFIEKVKTDSDVYLKSLHYICGFGTFFLKPSLLFSRCLGML